MSASIAHELVQRTLLGDALDGGPVAIFIADDEQRYLAVNDFACRLLGYTRADLLALRVTDVAVNESAASDYAQMVRRRHGEGTAVLRGSDGRDIPVGYRAARTVVGGMELFVGVCWPLDDLG